VCTHNHQPSLHLILRTSLNSKTIKIRKMADSYSEDDYSYTYSDDDEMDSQTSYGAESMDYEGIFPSSRGKSTIEIRGSASTSNTGSPLIRMSSSSELMAVFNARISEVCELFNLPRSVAQVLFRHFRWNKERLCEHYTSNPDKVMKDAGVAARFQLGSVDFANATPIQRTTTCVMTRQRQAAQKRTCPICMEDDKQPSDMMQMPCKHEFCTDCWTDFIETMIKDGPTCINQTCPQARCNEIVTEDEVTRIKPDFESKYESFQLRSFVELNGTSRWCPGPGCERVACLSVDSASLSFTDSTINVTCDTCFTSFCLKCGEEPHAPLVCKDLVKWQQKCRNESETANWMLANTKPCPKCSSRIEKNQGCNHMTCRQCKHEFCWICMGDWVNHGENTGGYYSCNKFNADEEDGGQGMSDAVKAKRELDRYLHYYKRYHAHAQAQKFALKQQKETEERMMLSQVSYNNVAWTDLEFLKVANEQLVECRRVLKYTYCYAYYMPDRSHGSTSDEREREERLASIKGDKERFEYHQSMLERFTEGLSELVEKPLSEISRVDVVNKTRVVNNFMKNILKYIEEGMDTY